LAQAVQVIHLALNHSLHHCKQAQAVVVVDKVPQHLQTGMVATVARAAAQALDLLRVLPVAELPHLVKAMLAVELVLMVRILQQAQAVVAQVQ
jgi:hypothetical protein